MPAWLKKEDNEIEKKISHFPKVKAKVVLFRCNDMSCEGMGNLFGVRIEERNKIWFRTWAFKIDEIKAKHEGWDSEKITSSLSPADEYNGCPYCGSFSLAQCPCGKMFCFGEKDYSKSKQAEIKCPWCGKTSLYQTAEAFDVQGGGM